MTILKVRLENCYGIKRLEYDFEFTDASKTYAIYAPNGVMKTSFAQTFNDLAAGKIPRDRMDASMTSAYEVKDDSGNQIDPKTICVIESYNEKIFDTAGDKALTLLSNEDTRNEYRAIYDELDNEKQILIKQLKKVSGSSNCEEELYNAFSVNGETVFDVFEKVLDNSKASEDRYDFRYNDVFDKSGKVKAFLDENSQLLDEYSAKYDELISNSDFFSKNEGNIFGTSEAKTLSDSVKGNEFFNAGHALSIKKYGNVGDNGGFRKIVDEEIGKIFNDEKLKSVFEKVEKKLGANKDLAAFKKVIERDPGLVVKLTDYEALKKEVWYSYLNQMIGQVESIVDLYKKKKPALEDIVKKANDQRSKWEDALDEFRDRFVNIPFTLEIEDKADAILNAKVPGITFKFEDKPVDRSQLLEILSQGEKRAFYILNIIFEIRSRDTLGQKTLFIIDDIADSFDYKNKYAIVEYLNDIVKNDKFYSIILTHNFDFYRTISSRLGVDRQHKLHALKNVDGVELIQEVYQKPPFITWRNCMKSGQYHDKNYTVEDAMKHIIALVPFTRNLIEYSGKDDETSTSLGDTDYNVLTSLLHSKSDAQTITFGDLKKIFNTHLNKDDFDASIPDNDPVYSKIIGTAGSIANEEFNLENKIILAIAIRLKAEEYMLSKLTDTSPAGGNQTGVFFDRYKVEFGSLEEHKQACRVLESVNIMTPENIHLNSFMYEPILDMGITELKELYQKVTDLS